MGNCNLSQPTQPELLSLRSHSRGAFELIYQPGAQVIDRVLSFSFFLVFASICHCPCSKPTTSHQFDDGRRDWPKQNTYTMRRAAFS